MLPMSATLLSMKTLTPADCAKRWGVTKKEVMRKIYNTLAYVGDKTNDRLPPGFKIRRVNSDKYQITVPEDYKFSRAHNKPGSFPGKNGDTETSN